MISTFVVWVPGCPRSVNAGGGGSRSHHMAAHREKMRWQETFEGAFMARGIPRRMAYCVVDVWVRWRRDRGQEEENYRHPVLKPLFDALERGGWIERDTREFVRCASFQFEYPESWEWRDPRVRAELVIRLEAVYDDAVESSPAASDRRAAPRGRGLA